MQILIVAAAVSAASFPHINIDLDFFIISSIKNQFRTKLYKFIHTTYFRRAFFYQASLHLFLKATAISSSDIDDP